MKHKAGQTTYNQEHAHDVTRHGHELDPKIGQTFRLDGVVSTHGSSHIGREEGVSVEDDILYCIVRDRTEHM